MPIKTKKLAININKKVEKKAAIVFRKPSARPLREEKLKDQNIKI